MSKPITQDELSLQLHRLEDAVADRVAAERTVEDDFGASRDPRQEALALAVRERETAGQQDVSRLDAEHTERVHEMNARYDAEQTSLETERRVARNRVETEAGGEVAAVNQKHDESRWVAQSVLDETAEESPKRQYERIRVQLEKSNEQQQVALDALRGDVQAAMAERNWSREAPPPPESAPGKLDELAAAFAESVDSAREGLARLSKLRVPKLFVGMRPLWLFVLLLIGAGVPAYFLLDPSLVGVTVDRTEGSWIGMVAVAALVLSLLLLTVLYTLSSLQLSDVFSHMQEESTAATFYHERWEQAAATQRLRKQQEFEAKQQKMEAQLGQQLKRFEAAHQQTLADVESRREVQINQIEADFRQREADLLQRRQAELSEAAEFAGQQKQNAARHFENDRGRLQREHDEYVSGRQQAMQRAVQQLASNWTQSLQSVAIAQAAADEASQDWFPSWKSLSGDAWQPPKVIPPGIRIGHQPVDLAKLPGGEPVDPALRPQQTTYPFPTVLAFPSGASLLMKTDGPASRRAAVQAMQVAVLRMLTLLPPGKLRLSVFDPIGLGESFSGLMHLADYDELLITSRIWTETAQFEARLADLTEHMENVLQKYLRNEFSSIEAYNEFAGEVAEPYHVLVVADFPSKFSEQAARRLTSIATSGPRCGVYLLMSADPSQPTPHGFQLADVEESATTLAWHDPATASVNDSGWGDVGDELDVSDALEESSETATDAGETAAAAKSRLGDEPAYYYESNDAVLDRWPLVIDTPPPPETFTKIVKAVGEASKDLRRVEVSFERIAPQPDDVWSKDSRSGIDIPLGRAGATKLQHLRLGKGTSQHMLVAGKTGSGKSTFFHALITNAAMYYSPDELEFYLVDFKKGVEFKAYAGGRLPHARVIAIESDREFGISVLQRLDAILHERGELFRELGVQDVAGYRERMERESASPHRGPMSAANNGDATDRRGSLMPRIMLVIDEFQEFFVEDDRFSQQAALLLDRLVRQGRAFGVHVILGSQTLGGAYSLARSTLGQVAVRVALQCSEADAHLILSESNTAARLLTRPGEAIYNDSNGTVEGNHPFQIAWLPDEEREGYLRVLQQFAEQREMTREPAIVFEGNIPSNPARNAQLMELIEAKEATSLAAPTVWLGEAVEIGPPTSVTFAQQAGSNLLLVGQDPQAATGILTTSYLALAAQVPRSGESSAETSVPRLWVLNGSHLGSPEAEYWKQIAGVRADATRIVTPGNLATALRELTAEVGRREEVGTTEVAMHPPLFVLVNNLSKLRDLRKGEDEYGFSGFGAAESEKPADPAKMFADLIARGPEQGVHVLAWVDSANNLDRWLSRQSLKEFELRILFAMNAADSSNLIDSPAAAKLGPHRALLYREETGTSTKFRPYGPPDEEWLGRVRLHLSAAAPLESALDLDGFQVS